MQKLSKANSGVNKASFRGQLGLGSMPASKVWRSEKGSMKAQESIIGGPVEKVNSSWCGLVTPDGQFDFLKFKKSIITLRYNTKLGNYWDVIQVLLSILACGIYVSESYYDSYHAIHLYSIIETVITQFFLFDFLVSWFISSSSFAFFKSPMTWVDIVTIIPVYLSYINSTPNLSLLRFVRILRLVRILRTFRLLGGFSGVRRQIITLSLTLLSMIFLAAGIIHLTENTFNELYYDCQYVSAKTNYEPSCHKSYSSYNDPSCDCRDHDCYALHSLTDKHYEPSEVSCRTRSFFESLYFIVVTTSVVGYGDYMPTTQPSRIVTVIFIISALIVIPMQINRLQTLLTMNSPFRTTYEPRPHENHVILCGFVNDKVKLSRIFREFFHPDRHSSNSPEFHLLVLNPSEPNDDVKELLNSPLFDSRVSYIIGSALNMEDLQKARADVASAIFFLCNNEVDEEDAVLDDAATVLRTLSVNNFNPNLECLVQVLRSQDRELLKDTDVEVVLCFDEYKTTLQCRNAVCPGLATFIDNLFQSFGSSTGPLEKVREHWMSEYLHGARMELYYIPIDMGFFAILGHSWPLLVECIYLEFECTFVGVCNVHDHSAHINPRQAERKKFKTLSSFFDKHNVGILMAPNSAIASAIGYAMTDPILTDRMISNMLDSEEQFAVRRHHAVGSLEGASLTKQSSGLKILGYGTRMAALMELRKIQNLIDGDFVGLEKRRASLVELVDPSHVVDPGMDSDSSQENDDDFVGFVEKHTASPSLDNTRRQAVTGNSTSILSNLTADDYESKDGGSNEVNPVALKIDTSFSLTRSSSMGFTQVIKKKTSSLTMEEAEEEGTSSSSDDDRTPSKKKEVAKRSSPVLHEEMALLDDASSSNFKDMRMYGGGSRLAKGAGKKSLKTLVKKNKMRSLREVTALLKEANNTSEGGATTPVVAGGAKGKFAMLAKRAAASSTLNPKLAGSRPVSIMSALQQTRRNSIDKKKASKMSLLDVARAAKLRESLKETTGSAPSEGAVNAILMFTSKKPKAPLASTTAAPALPSQAECEEEDLDEESKLDAGKTSTAFKSSVASSAVNVAPFSPPKSPHADKNVIDAPKVAFESPAKADAVTFDSPGPSISAMVNKFRVENDQRRSFRRVLSTRKSTSFSEEDPVQETEDAPKKQRMGSDVSKKQRRGSFVADAMSTSGAKASSQRRFIDKKESGGSFRLSGSAASSNPMLARSDSTVGELISCTASPPKMLDRTMALRHTSQMGLNGRRGSVDTGMRIFGDTSAITKETPEQVFGQESEEIEDAAGLRNHIIVFGSMDHIHMFVAELRKPLVVDDSYHQILIVNPGEPRKWYQIQNRYKDVYYLDSNVSSSYEMTLMNVRNAYSLVLLAARETISVEETANIDSDALFMYLKMERFVPKDVFFTVELVCPNNMGVLNSAIVRRARIEKDANQKASDWGGTATGLASCLKGAHNFRASIDVNSMLSQLKSEAEYSKKAEITKQTSGRFSRLSGKKVRPQSTIGDSDLYMNDRRMSMSALRRYSSGSVPAVSSAPRKEIQKMSTGNYWDAVDSHHVLPVFASGRAIVSTSYDSLLVQSFYGALTPQLCEKLLGGQETQTMFHTPVPSSFFGRKYVDLFRALNSRRILPVGLYRTPLPKNDAILPYLFTNPPMETVVNGDDRILLFGNPETLGAVLKKFELPLVRKNGKMSLGEETQSVKPANKPREKRNSMNKKGNVAAGQAYQPIQARHDHGGESKDAETPGLDLETKPSTILKPSSENSPIPAASNESGSTENMASKGWGALLGARIHPINKYMRSKSRSMSPPAQRHMSKDTGDIADDTVRKFSVIEKEKSA